MRPNPDIHPQARADQRRQFEYLRDNYAGPLTLRKFIAAMREAKSKIRDNPKTWSYAPGSKRVRKVQVLEFRFQVFYTIQKNGVPLILEFAGPGLQPRGVDRL